MKESSVEEGCLGESVSRWLKSALQMVTAGREAVGRQLGPW